MSDTNPTIRIAARAMDGSVMAWNAPRFGFGADLDESEFCAVARAGVAEEVVAISGEQPRVVLVCLHGNKNKEVRQ